MLASKMFGLRLQRCKLVQSRHGLAFVMFLKDLGLPLLDVFFDIVSMVQFCQRRQFIWLSCIASALAFSQLGGSHIGLGGEETMSFHSSMW